MLRKERERERAVIFSVLVCLPAGMWALSLRPPPPRRRRERTNACAIRGPEHGEHRNRRNVIKETVAAVPGQLSSDSKRTRAGFDPRRGEPLISHGWAPIKVAPRWIFTVVGSEIGRATVGSGWSEEFAECLMTFEKVWRCLRRLLAWIVARRVINVRLDSS